jgi:hypothetical protein
MKREGHNTGRGMSCKRRKGRHDREGGGGNNDNDGHKDDDNGGNAVARGGEGNASNVEKDPVGALLVE